MNWALATPPPWDEAALRAATSALALACVRTACYVMRSWRCCVLWGAAVTRSTYEGVHACAPMPFFGCPKGWEHIPTDGHARGACSTESRCTRGFRPWNAAVAPRAAKPCATCVCIRPISHKLMAPLSPLPRAHPATRVRAGSGPLAWRHNFVRL